MKGKFGVFVGAVILETVDVVGDLKSAFDMAYGDYVTSGGNAPCPKIRRVTAKDMALVTRVVASGSLQEQAATVLRAIKATLGGTVILDVTSNHIKNWLSGKWRPKSSLAQQLVEAVEEAALNGVVVVAA